MTLTITIDEDGCLVVETGGAHAVDGGGPQEQARIARCRCGQSANEPFCDGTHTRVGFEAPGGEIVPSARRPGRPRVTPRVRPPGARRR